jgi:integrase
MSVKVRQKIVSSGKVAIYFDVSWKNTRRWKATGLIVDPKDKPALRDALKAATQKAAQLTEQLQYDGIGAVAPSLKKTDFVEYFEKMSETKNRSYRFALQHLRAFAPKKFFSDITPLWVESFGAYLTSVVSPNSAHLYYAHIRHALRRAYKEGYLNANVAEKSDGLHKAQVEKSFLTLEELSRFASAKPHNEHAASVQRAFLFASFSGLRISDVRNLTAENLTSIDGQTYLTFRAKKTGKPDIMPLHQTAQRFWDAQIQATGKPFGDSLKAPAQVIRALAQLCKDADITKHITFHTSRHSYAVNALSSGISAPVLQTLLQHSNLATTMVYAKVLDGAKLQAVKMLPTLKTAD